MITTPQLIEKLRAEVADLEDIEGRYGLTPLLTTQLYHMRKLLEIFDAKREEEMKKYGWVHAPELPVHGRRVELVEEKTIIYKVKIMEPTDSPAWKVGDVISILKTQFRNRRF